MSYRTYARFSQGERRKPERIARKVLVCLFLGKISLIVRVPEYIMPQLYNYFSAREKLGDVMHHSVTPD